MKLTKDQKIENRYGDLVLKEMSKGSPLLEGWYDWTVYYRYRAMVNFRISTVYVLLTLATIVVHGFTDSFVLLPGLFSANALFFLAESNRMSDKAQFYAMRIRDNLDKIQVEF